MRYPEVGQDVVAIKQNFTFRTLLRVQFKHFVEGTQQRRFTAAGRPDKRRYLVFSDIQVDVFQGMEFAVVEVQITNLNFTRGSFNHTHCNLFLIVPDALR